MVNARSDSSRLEDHLVAVELLLAGLGSDFRPHASDGARCCSDEPAYYSEPGLFEGLGEGIVAFFRSRFGAAAPVAIAPLPGAGASGDRRATKDTLAA